MMYSPRLLSIDVTDCLPDALLVLDKSWRVTFMNASAESLFKRSREQMQGKIIWEEYPNLIGTGFYRQCRHSLKHKAMLQIQEYIASAGQYYDVTLSPFPDGLCVYLRDMVFSRQDRKREPLSSAVEHYYEGSSQFREPRLSAKGCGLFQRMIRHGCWEWNMQNNTLSLSEEMKVMMGLTEWDALDEPWELLARIHHEDRREFRRKLQETPLGGSMEVLLRYTHPDGEIRHMQCIVETEWCKNLKISRLVAAVRDITEHVQQEQRLVKSEEMYHLIAENTQDVITVSDGTGIMSYVSPGVTHVLGFLPEELQGLHQSTLIHPADQQKTKVQPGEESHIIVCRARHKSKQYVWLEINTKIVYDDSGHVVKYIGMSRDITQRIAAEEQVARSEKLSLTGQLAAGIAHEIRNPLTAIKGFLQLFDSGYSLKKEHVQVMNSELMRIESILNELLLLAKPHEMRFVRKDLNQIIRQVVTLMQTEAIMKDVLLRFAPSEGELMVDCDENQLKQVFINLIKNGMEAMEHGGELTVETAISKECIAATFTDQGRGMTKEQMEKIGQPFFTTKEEGTGLGLAVSYTIIESHGGNVKINSELNRGTAFIVQLPYSIHA